MHEVEARDFAMRLSDMLRELAGFVGPIGWESDEDRQRIRESEEYTEWRKAVLKRDEYMCRICQMPERKLHAHHIRSFYWYPALRLDIDNGLTLCERCHAILHGKEYDDSLESPAAQIPIAYEEGRIAGIRDSFYLSKEARFDVLIRARRQRERVRRG